MSRSRRRVKRKEQGFAADPVDARGGTGAGWGDVDESVGGSTVRSRDLLFGCVGPRSRRRRTRSVEIQVYDGALTRPGHLSLTLHNNYAPDGLKTAAFPGAVVSDGSLNGVPEFAFGVTPWFEAGVYLPLYTVERRGGARLDGYKLRALFATPNADERSFFYGVNFEFSVNARHWDQKRYGGEIRPIIGARSGPWTVVVNPILDTDFTGLGRVEFAPSTRIAYAVDKRWAVAVETYSNFGELRRFAPGRLQSHQLFGVIDFSSAPFDVEFGAGIGLNRASDRFTLKLVLSRAFQ